MKMSRARTIAFGALGMLLVLPLSAGAQTDDDLAKQTQNPVASLITLPTTTWETACRPGSARRTRATHNEH